MKALLLSECALEEAQADEATETPAEETAEVADAVATEEKTEDNA